MLPSLPYVRTKTLLSPLLGRIIRLSSIETFVVKGSLINTTGCLDVEDLTVASSHPQRKLEFLWQASAHSAGGGPIEWTVKMREKKSRICSKPVLSALNKLVISEIEDFVLNYPAVLTPTVE